MSLNDGLIGHWPLAGDARDRSARDNHGRAANVDFSAAGRDGKPGSAALFNGVDACIEVRDSASLKTAAGDFAVAAWVRLDADVSDVVGDVMSKYDAAVRRGFNLCVKSSSPTYNSQGDSRQVHFGIDNGMDSPWEDCGAIWPTNTYVSSLTVFKGSLYAGVADSADKEDACHVVRYAGGTKWEDCGRVSPDVRDHSAYSLLVHKGDLYCGTGRQDWRTAGPEHCVFSRVFRYAGGKEWVDGGQPGRNYRILSLASFKGQLYCGTDDMQELPKPGEPERDAGKVYRHLGGTEWEDCGRLGANYHVFSLGVHNGHLYGGCDGEIWRYDGGREWTYTGKPFGNTQVHTLQVHRGKLWAGTWPQGYICSYEGGTEWTDCGIVGVPPRKDRGPFNEINDLTVYNGKLYAGVIPKGEVYRYEGGKSWTMLRRLASNPDYNPYKLPSWARVPSLTEFNGRLYAGTGSCCGDASPGAHPEFGRVYSFMAGQAISYNDDIGAGWKHIAAVREGGRLRLHIDGKLESASEAFPSDSYNLDNIEPLLIGFGAVDFFSGSMQDVRLYNRALLESECAALAAAR